MEILGIGAVFAPFPYNARMRKFIRQLRERHVVKVCIAYLVVAWLVLQLADVIFPALGLPDWTISLALALLVIGFPVALVLAWVFDLTPDGIERTDADSEPALPGLVRKTSGDDLSIAVLPFPDLSAEQDQEHFCDGLTDELLNVLTCIPNLRVASRTSSFAFKGKDTNLSEVSEKLNVGHVLEGSVRKSGNRVRISAKLIGVKTDSTLWSETYDRELCDIFEIQDDIAKRILEALKLKLTMGTRKAPTTENAKAYEYFLRGRGNIITHASHDVDQAREMFEKAVDLDPGFIRAWICLAEVNSTKAIFLGGGEAAQRDADKASEKAMQLAPDLSGSHLARGFAQMACHCYVDAEAAFQRALELDPAQVRAWHWLGRVAHHQGHKQKELEYFSKAAELDPEDWESPVLTLATYERLGDLDSARNSAEIAIARIERHLEDYPDNPRAYYLGLGALTVLEDYEKAGQWARRALELGKNDAATHYNVACYYSGIGEIEKALDLLENSIQSRSWIENDADLDPIRDHPRYRAFIETLAD